MAVGGVASPLTEEDWQRLIRRLRRQEGTPFIGTGCGFGGALPRPELARRLHDEYRCPWPPSFDLARVTQFISTTKEPLEPAERVADILAALPPPDLSDRGNGYRLAAELPFRIYVTTAMDQHLLEAMRRIPVPRDAMERVCRWNDKIDETLTSIPQDYSPTPANPLIFHLYGGARWPAAMVLTEDDYLDLLVRATTDPPVLSMSQSAAQPAIPQVVKGAIASGPLIFLGYRFADLEFRVLVRLILRQLQQNPSQNHLVLLVGEEAETDAARILELQNFYTKYCARAPLYIRACWTSATAFLQELKDRWNP